MIRPIEAGDIPSYKALRLEMLELHPEAFGGSVEETKAMSEEDLLAWLDKSMVYGAFENSALIGTAAFYTVNNLKSRHQGRLFGVYIRPEHRGKGIAHKLMEAVLDHAKGLVKQIHTCVTTTNDSALRLYQKFGFEVYGTEPRGICLGDHCYDLHLLVKFFDD